MKRCLQFTGSNHYSCLVNGVAPLAFPGIDSPLAGNEISISNVTTVMTGNSVNITWNTSSPGDGTIQIGPTKDYGLVADHIAAPATTFSSTINGLNPGVPYYFRIESIDSNAHVATYDGSFGGPTPLPTVPAIEYYNASQDHYFVSSLTADINALNTGFFKGWERTGLWFNVYPVTEPGASPVCRFYIPPAQGDSHFYSASPIECAQVAARFPTFILESSNVMDVGLPDATTGTCPTGWTPVYRVWDDRADSNHRYITGRAVRDQMVAKGWIAEGYGPDSVIMCSPP
jgi:hypothetical protein